MSSPESLITKPPEYTTESIPDHHPSADEFIGDLVLSNLTSGLDIDHPAGDLAKHHPGYFAESKTTRDGVAIFASLNETDIARLGARAESLVKNMSLDPERNGSESCIAYGIGLDTGVSDENNDDLISEFGRLSLGGLEPVPRGTVHIDRIWVANISGQNVMIRRYEGPIVPIVDEWPQQAFAVENFVNNIPDGVVYSVSLINP